jgi:predicted RNA-binding protein with PUA-like domain
MNYWIVKTDADAYPFDQFERDRRAVWDGVANALALRHIRGMAPGDRVLVYHSGADKALVGLARVASAPYADPKRQDPKLAVVDLEAEGWLRRPVALAELKTDRAFADLGLVRQPRLSVMPVTPAQWERLLVLGNGTGNGTDEGAGIGSSPGN